MGSKGSPLYPPLLITTTDNIFGVYGMLGLHMPVNYSHRLQIWLL